MAISQCSVQTKGSVSEEGPDNMDLSLKEAVFHGTSLFPLAIYEDNICEREVNWHWHEEFEIGWITEGVVRIEAGTRRYLLRQGDGFFINSGVIHAVRNGESSAPAALKSIVFHRSIVGGSVGSIFDSEYIIPILENGNFPEALFYWNESDDREILALVEEAWQAVFLEEPDYPLKAREKLSRLFVWLVRRSGRPVCTSADRVRESRARSMLELIHSSYGQDITLNDIARQAAVSTSEALRCFHLVVGTSPMQYLKKYRLYRAAWLLREGQLSVSEICTLCGFQDHSYFTRSFRQIYGCPPSRYS